MGRALSELREENIAIVGSGMSFHNMKAFRQSGHGGDAKGKQDNELFEDAIQNTVENGSSESLEEWQQFPGATYCHPPGHTEHLMPLLVTAGAGGQDKGKRVVKLDLMGTVVSSYLWS